MFWQRIGPFRSIQKDASISPGSLFATSNNTLQDGDGNPEKRRKRSESRKLKLLLEIWLFFFDFTTWSHYVLFERILGAKLRGMPHCQNRYIGCWGASSVIWSMRSAIWSRALPSHTPAWIWWKTCFSMTSYIPKGCYVFHVFSTKIITFCTSQVFS